MKVGIIGAGTMGAGIAQVFAAVDGYQVLLGDISKELAEQGKERMAGFLQSRVEKGRMEKDVVDALLGRITTGLTQDMADCDLIVEAALENMEVKKDLFQSLDKVCKEDTIFATNTSSLSITAIGQGVTHDVIGMHFFNPAPVMKLVEVISGINTKKATKDRIIAVSKEIGKTPVEVEEGAGFVVNRLLVPMINEAVGIYADGMASAEDIDTAMQLGANHPMGPLALGDLVGLDVCLAIMEVLHQEMGEDKYRPHPLLRKMVRGGLLGRKSGQGFYQY